MLTVQQRRKDTGLRRSLGATGKSVFIRKFSGEVFLNVAYSCKFPSAGGSQPSPLVHTLMFLMSAPKALGTLTRKFLSWEQGNSNEKPYF